METERTKKCSENYLNLLKEFSEPSVPLLNGHVAYQVYQSNGAPMVKVSNNLSVQNNLVCENDIAGYRRVANAVRKLMSVIKRDRRTGNRCWDKLVSFMHTPFSAQPLPDYSKLLKDEMSSEMTGGIPSMEDGQLTFLDEHSYFISGGDVCTEVPNSTEVENKISAEVKHEPVMEKSAFFKDKRDFVEKIKQSETLTGYRLRGNKCSRCVIRNQSIRMYKERIKKLREETTAGRVLKFQYLKGQLRRKSLQIQNWKAKYVLERNKNQRSKQHTGNDDGKVKGMDEKTKELMILRIQNTKLQKKFQVVSDHHLQVIRELRSQVETAKSETTRLQTENSRLALQINELMTEKLKTMNNV
ncbi:uncharacterized protein LOC131952526 [Physella acuta]|uniref:uncharacterized protein LOC131952526 n=1 Tax=Physella acuta TaxID=109671 RepID=UPI0027DC14E4|nr:uncharacterized protein LOC131952526 [Physella acuta]XP_059171216.1 uncharacterized protein LOC131952526 [Physella acuta]XP_059171217.1 uncharacterized protein LOC131952526 [Physella acuta]XP_059171218.1 uncharacterized protein LOC131952526 [Physella acuta]